MSGDLGAPVRSHAPSEFLQGLARLLLVMVTGAALGLLAYLAYVLIIRVLVNQPTDDFRQAFSISETRQALAEERSSARLREYSERLAALEIQGQLDAQALDELTSQLDALQAGIENQAGLLEQITALEDSLVALAERQDETGQQLAEGAQALTGLQATLEAQGAETAPTAGLLQAIRMLHALELLDRGRLYLLQNNLGLAKQDVLAARDVLSQMQAAAGPAEQVALTDWIDRLEAIAGDLPQTPRQAAIDLETVWNLMIAGLQPAENMLTPVPAASQTPKAE